MQMKSIEQIREKSFRVVTEDSVFQANPILQTETVFDRPQLGLNEEQKEIMSQTGGTPMVATLTSDNNESRKMTASPFCIPT